MRMWITRRDPQRFALENAMAFTLTSTTVDEGGAIPARFTCDGDNVSPDLAWSDAPEQTAAFALILDDPDARHFAHWLVYNMTASASGGLPEGAAESPDGPPQGTNDFGKIGFGGPCPPSGTHRYQFTLYALDDLLDLPTPPRADALRAALAGHALETAVLTATYTRRAK
jgi:Raf kinase inhibitor-like YbhB/YbcL family protein